MQGGINYTAIFAAALIHNLIGVVWYSRFAFGNVWLRLVHKTDDRVRSPLRAYTLNFLSALLMSYVLAHFIEFLNVDTVEHGIILGFLLWAGFIAAGSASVYIFEERPRGLYTLNAAYQLLAITGMSAFLAVWR